MDANKLNKILSKLDSEYLSKDNFKSIGLKLSSLSDSRNSVLYLAYDFLESWNNHAICGMLNTIFDLYDYKHLNELQALKELIDNEKIHEVKVGFGIDAPTKKYKIHVTLMEVE